VRKLPRAPVPGIRDRIEIIEVASPATTERYTGNFNGSILAWKSFTEAEDLATTLINKYRMQPPGLHGFYMVGQWIGMGGLIRAAASGRFAIQFMCLDLGKKFQRGRPRRISPVKRPGWSTSSWLRVSVLSDGHTLLPNPFQLESVVMLPPKKRETMIIIGAGLGGLSTGCYAQMNGYQTRILELHELPEVLHGLGARCLYLRLVRELVAGKRPGNQMHQIWLELGALQGKEIRQFDAFNTVQGPDGRTVHFYSDPDRLEAHLLNLSPVRCQGVRVTAPPDS